MRRRPVAVYRVIDESALLAEQASEVPDALPPPTRGCPALSAASDGEVSFDGWPPESVAPYRELTHRRVRVFLGMCALALVAAGALTVVPLGTHGQATVEGHAAAIFQPLRNHTQNIESGGDHRDSLVRAPRHWRSRMRARVARNSQVLVEHMQRSPAEDTSTVNVSHPVPRRPASPAREFGFER
jgi:hypothetical protein